jgi:AGCS family alanine or glycine:cation symporter
MLETINSYLTTISGFIWNNILIVLLLGTGIFLAIRSKVIQFRGFKHGWQLITGKFDDPNEKGETTHFQSLSIALSATIGTGNIAGVATAIVAGGPGALFWMWLTALFGMGVKFHSCLLAQKYRHIDKNGVVSGGPAYYLANGLKQKWLGMLFALFTVIASFGIGNLVQANSLSKPIFTNFGIESIYIKLIFGIIIAILVGLVILGGVKRISVVASKLVPFMAVFYVLAALIVLILNYKNIPNAFSDIFYFAFHDTTKSVTGGIAGITVMSVMRFGIARGLFSNEAGLGSAAMAHAPAKTDEPVREGLVAMLGPFIDTIVVCTMTGLVILVSGALGSVDSAGEFITSSDLTSLAFSNTLPGVGQYIVTFGLFIFAFTTLIGWSYYGDRNIEYLFGEKIVKYYKILWILLIPIGTIAEVSIVWNFSDIANALMAIPNLIGLIGLSGVVVKMTNEYMKNKNNFKPLK